MNHHYLRSKAIAYNKSRSDEERAAAVYHLAVHLGIIRTWQNVTQSQQEQVFTCLETLGLEVQQRNLQVINKEQRYAI